MSPAGHSHRLGSSDVGATYRSDGGPSGIAVLGAGPAGLTAAYLLGSRGARAAVYEADRVVGGLARTVQQDCYRFDLGGHRFFTKIEPVQRLWEKMLGDDFLTRPHISRIYYRGGFLAYPPWAADVVSRLGASVQAFRCVPRMAGSSTRRRPAPVSRSPSSTSSIDARR